VDVVEPPLELSSCDLGKMQDPAQASHHISGIAFAWGFSDLSHFNRRFKAAFGCAPRDYRRQPQRST
jgi:AraC-like DNA-binding protein